MKRFITRINGFCDPDLKRKQAAVANSAYASGWMDMALYVYNNTSESDASRTSRFDGIIAGISSGDIVVVQLPTGNGHSWEQRFISHIKAYGGKVILYLHALEFQSNIFNDLVKDTIHTCYYQQAVIVDSFEMRQLLYNNGIKKNKSIFVREEANAFFDEAYYIAKTLNLASESVLLGDKCKYQLMQKENERKCEENAFSYYVARESYGGKHAISFQYSGDADIIVIKAGDRTIWQTDNLLSHYALVEPEAEYSIHAMVYTQTGKLAIASTKPFPVSKPSFQKNSPKISLIIPMYNSSNFIARTIDSVLGQSQDDIELLLVDDESPDNTTEVVEWYMQRFESVQLIRKKNGGQGSARNAGIDYAHGQYITFMDHDDTLPPNSQKILYELITSTNTDIGIGNTINMIDDGQGIVIHHSQKSQEVYDAESYMKTHSPVMIWHKIYKAELCKKVHFGPRYHEDISWSPIIFSYANSISLTSGIVYEWDRSNVTQSTSNLKRSEEWFTETYCIAVKDALERCNPARMPLVKKMILSCESFNYHPGLYLVVEKLTAQY